jgi:tetratricopeptide (TPR) repeat protein
VIGRRFATALLSALGIENPEQNLAVLKARGLIAGPTSHVILGPSYSFRHALLRDAAYASLTRAERSRLHAAIARQLEASAERNPSVLASAVAEHYAATIEHASQLADGLDRAGMARSAARWYERAATAAVAARAFDSGSTLFEKAIGFTAEGASADRARLLRGLGESRRRAGALVTSMDAFREASECSRWVRDVVGFAEAALGYEDALAASRLERDASSVQLLEDLLWVLPSAPGPERARTLAALGRNLAYTGAIERGMEAAGQAVGMARTLGDPEVLAYTLLAQHIALSEPEWLLRRERIATEMCAAAASAGNTSLELEAVRMRIIDLLAIGDTEQLDGAIAQAGSLIERLGQPLYFWYPAVWAAMRALFEGRYQEAEVCIEAFGDEGRLWGYQDAEHVYGAQLLLLRRDQGRAREMRASCERLAAGTARLSYTWRCLLVALDIATGQRQRAEATIAELAADGFATLPSDLTRGANAAFLAEASAALGLAGPAEHLFEILLPYRDQAVAVGSGAWWLGSAAYFIGLCCLTTGRTREAISFLQEAVHANARMAGYPWEARSRLALAAALNRAGRGSLADGEENRARALAESIGLRLD